MEKHEDHNVTAFFDSMLFEKFEVGQKLFVISVNRMGRLVLNPFSKQEWEEIETFKKKNNLE